MTDLDDIIHQTVIDIWSKFDRDNNEILDKVESRRFVDSILGKDAKTFTKFEFERLFKEFDKNGKGVIEKKEMAKFLKRALGLNI